MGATVTNSAGTTSGQSFGALGKVFSPPAVWAARLSAHPVMTLIAVPFERPFFD
jgi:hypothetical protein